MRSRFFLIIAAVIIVVFAFYFKSAMEKRNKVCFRGYCFTVETASNAAARKTGLMFQAKLGQNEGMLFVFDEESEHSFWMKNTLIPLDIIWINARGEAVFISKNNQPCGNGLCLPIKPGKKAKYVLELNAGMAEKTGLIIGDKININKH